MPELKTFYFTFGCGFPLADFVQVVRAPSEPLARVGMYRFYCDRWCSVYGEDEVKLRNYGNLAEIGTGERWMHQYDVLRKVITVYGEHDISCG